MRVDLQLNSGITLKMATGPSRDPLYPTARIQKGLILLYEGRELCEEAVGFGVPILKRGLQAIFPGGVELSPQLDSTSNVMHARFRMDLEERLTKKDSRAIQNPLIYAGKNSLAAIIRERPAFRGTLTRLSSLLRKKLAWETTYEPSAFSTWLNLSYFLDTHTGRIRVELDARGLSEAGITEVVLMNEQGARFFDQYQDTNGVTLEGSQIGCWDPVLANEATFLSRELGITFSLPYVTGARLFRGRELIGTRLAWAGFGYSFPPSLTFFSYEIKVKKL